MMVAIDPGHGMANSKTGVYDPGAVGTLDGTTYQEATVALRYGLRLRDILASQQVDVFMTRVDATTPTPVGKRASRAEQAGCTLFVSLHLNAADSTQANGLEVLYRRDADRKLAETMRDALAKAGGLRARDVVQRDNLAVLKFNGPAILIELGFISNAGDLSKLLDPAIQETLCQTMAGVINPGVADAPDLADPEV